MSSPSVARQLARYFLNGLLVVAPAGLTLYVCWLVFRTVDGWLALPIPGAGFVVTIALITLLGYLARNFITQTLLGWLDELFTRVPFVRLLYSALSGGVMILALLAVNWWPTYGWTGGAALLLCFFVLAGLGSVRGERQSLRDRDLIEYGAVFIGGLLILAITL